MKKFTLIFTSFLLVAFSIYLTGCATIASGTTQLVTITCNVEGATIKLDGRVIGKTPFTGEIKKNCDVITIEKDGYKPHTIALSTSIESWFFGNVITGGTLGSTTDFATGAAFKYSPASFQVELYPEGIGMNEFKNTYELRKFAMLNMSNIAIDLSNNSGQYLETAIYLSGQANNEMARNTIRTKLLQSDGDQVVFGNLMVEMLDTKS